MLMSRLLAMPVLIATVAIAMGTCIDALVKGVAPGAGLHHLLAWRFLFGAIIAGAVFLAEKRPRPSTEAIRFHTMRGLLQLFCAVTFFYALTQLKLAEAGETLVYVTPDGDEIHARDDAWQAGQRPKVKLIAYEKDDSGSVEAQVLKEADALAIVEAMADDEAKEEEEEAEESEEESAAPAARRARTG